MEIQKWNLKFCDNLKYSVKYDGTILKREDEKKRNKQKITAGIDWRNFEREIYCLKLLFANF